jgi:CheY-like chemotaxis protein
MTHILLVDDVYTARSLVERILHLVAKYEVQTAASGVEALHAARITPPAVIVLDISMPQMDGIAALRALRAAEVICPIIAYTARLERTPGEFLALGFDAYVAKDGDVSNLLITIRRLLAGQHRSSQHRPAL